MPLHITGAIVSVIFETPADLKEFLGKEIGVSEWLTITRERILQFAEATEDRQWIHVDRERAEKESPYKTTIAHGFLTLSLVSRFMTDVIQIRSGVGMAINYGLNRVRFPSPVRAGSRIRGRVALLSLKEMPEALEAAFSVTVEAEGGEKPCCVAESIVRYSAEGHLRG
ncbi:MAG TPA: MaoC family dehydratase [Candidatus Acidoferrum sp.]|nr:MaoC family dehydratase [Candidatus Acidoferrum sp.]